MTAPLLTAFFTRRRGGGWAELPAIQSRSYRFAQVGGSKPPADETRSPVGRPLPHLSLLGTDA